MFYCGEAKLVFGFRINKQQFSEIRELKRPSNIRVYTRNCKRHNLFGVTIEEDHEYGYPPTVFIDSLESKVNEARTELNEFCNSEELVFSGQPYLYLWANAYD